MSFRARVFSASLATLAAGLGALLVLGNVLLHRQVAAETSGLLHARADAQIAALTVTPRAVEVRETANDETLDQQAWVLDGRRVVERPAGAGPRLDRAAVALARTTGEASGPGGERLYARRVPGRPPATVVVAVSGRPLERLQRSVLLGSAVVAALILIAGALAIRRTLTGALEPVRRMTHDAADWSAHDLDRRFHLGAPHDELTTLARTLDDLLDRIAASRRHEQRLADEVAHELRTPLAALRGRAELALLEPASDHRPALRTVVEQTARLGRAIDALLAVARAELDAADGPSDLVDLVIDIDDVELVVAAGVPPARADAEVVRRALAPLIDNARRHAAGEVRVELGSGDGQVTITVADDGPGVPADQRERVFDPGVRSTDGGAGLGLPLARRLARSCGGDVRAAEGPGGRFVLSLPAVR